MERSEEAALGRQSYGVPKHRFEKHPEKRRNMKNGGMLWVKWVKITVRYRFISLHDRELSSRYHYLYWHAQSSRKMYPTGRSSKTKKQVCVQRHSLLGGSILYHLGPGIYIYIYRQCKYIYIHLLEDETYDVYNICLCIFNLVHIYCCISIEYV